MIERGRVIDLAHEWIGTPFLHQGRSRHGADCAGFICELLAEAGCTVLRDYLPRAYGRDPRSLMINAIPELTRQIPLQPAALLVIKFPLMRVPAHAAIYTGFGRMIHSDQKSGGVVEHGYQDPWKARTVSIWALPGVMYE